MRTRPADCKLLSLAKSKGGRLQIGQQHIGSEPRLRRSQPIPARSPQIKHASPDHRRLHLQQLLADPRCAVPNFRPIRKMLYLRFPLPCQSLLKIDRFGNFIQHSIRIGHPRERKIERSDSQGRCHRCKPLVNSPKQRAMFSDCRRRHRQVIFTKLPRGYVA